MGHFIIALIALAFGFFLGVKSKAVPKRKSRKSGMDELYEKQLSGGNIQGSIHVKDRTKMPAHRNAPPPPPATKIIREGEAPPKPKSMYKKVDHVKPGTMYKKDTFVKVNKCTSCEAIGHEYDMFRTDPCPKCGGDVQRHGAAQWYHDHWAMSKA